MQQVPRAFIVGVVAVAALVLTGCGQPSTDTGDSPTTAGLTPSNPADAAAKAQQEFLAGQKRIEEERLRQKALTEHRRSLIEVAFKGIDAEGRVIVTMTNRTDRDIDDIRGGIHAEDADGNYLASTGLTEAVPGDVFLPLDISIEHAPYGFATKEALIERLRSDPSSVRFSFETLALTYADGSEEPGLDG